MNVAYVMGLMWSECRKEVEGKEVMGRKTEREEIEGGKGMKSMRGNKCSSRN